MHEPLSDKAIRQAVLDPGESFHVESPAGAGKTFLLTARFVRLLAEVDHPREILALTFTNKAAQEMLMRVQSLLRQAEGGIRPDSPWPEEILSAARKAIDKHRRTPHVFESSDGLNITTFHSFCSQIVKQAPLEAQVPLEASILEEEEQEEWVRETVDQVLKELGALPEADPRRTALERALLYYNNNRQGLADDLVRLTVQRDRLSDLLGIVRQHPGPEHLERTLKDRLGSFITYTLQDLKGKMGDTELGRNWKDFYNHLVLRKAEGCLALQPDLPGTGWSDLPAWQRMAELFTTREGTIRKVLGPAMGFYSGFKNTHWAGYLESLPGPVAELFQKIKSYPPPETSPVDVNLLFDLILLIAQVVDLYRRRCYSRGVFDFVELEQAALRVLGNEENPTELQLYLDRRLSHILVDEFQDTSLNQWWLIRYLCAGWSPGDGRTLFLVGDPKQSIYGFRKAEVSLFLKAKKGLPLPGQGLLPLKAVHIRTNFRSQKELIDFTNDLFSRTIMAHPRPEADEVPFLEAEAAPETLKKGPGILQMTLFRSEEKSSTAREREAAWLAQAVERAQEDPASESIGILLFARTQLPYYLKALYARGVQVQVREGLHLAERPEVQELLALFRALVRPQEDTAWVSLVRSCWCWLNLEDLLRLSRDRGETFAEKLFSFAERPEAPEALKRMTQVLKQRQDKIGRLPWQRLVQEIWEELSGPALVAERYALAGVRNCREFLHLLGQAEKGVGEETLARLEFLLAEAYAPPDPLSTRCQVTLLTVHHAKGLEFDTVFIPHVDRSPGEGAKEDLPYILERLPGEGEAYLIGLRPDRRIQNDSGVYALLKDLKKARRLGEAKRLYYVALTRAKRALFLSGIYSQKEEEKKAPAFSLLDYILRHPGIEDQIPIDYDPEVFPSCPKRAEGNEQNQEERPPLSFEAEPIPFKVVLPSSLAERYRPGEEDEKPFGWLKEESKGLLGKARGTVIHRILEDVALGLPLPSERAIALALSREGVEAESARETAPGILKEMEACLRDPFLVEILRMDHPFSACEIALEDLPDERTVRTGVIDRLIFNGKEWWVVDYKTTPPPPDMEVEVFLKQQQEWYRPQLTAYREMLFRARSLEPAVRVRLFLYFTALQRAVEMAGE